MLINNKSYRTIWYDNISESVKIIDQTKLPFKLEVISLKKLDDVIRAINEMKVRGAPLIGATAAYGIVLAIQEKNDQSFLQKSSEDLINSRPTAINLKWAVDRMIKKITGVNSDKIFDIAVKEAKKICDEDISFCKNSLFGLT